MSKMPIVSGRDLIMFFSKLEWYVDHQKGSHVHMKNDLYPARRITVPLHREITKPTMKWILSQAGLTRDQFVHLYERLK